jgi:hypothetical protein
MALVGEAEPARWESGAPGLSGIRRWWSSVEKKSSIAV